MKSYHLISVLTTEYLQGTDLSQLCEEVKNISDWYSLGLYLEIPESELKTIEANYPKVERRNQEVCATFIRSNPKASWKLIIQALNKMDENCLAGEIHEKYLRKRKPGNEMKN